MENKKIEITEEEFRKKANKAKEKVMENLLKNKPDDFDNTSYTLITMNTMIDMTIFSQELRKEIFGE